MGAIYVSILWFPTLVALVLRRTSGASAWARIRALTQPRNLVLLALPAVFFIVAVLVVQITHMIALGHSPDFFAYYEYGLSYAGGFALFPMVWVTSSYFMTRSADSNVTNILTPRLARDRGGPLRTRP